MGITQMMRLVVALCALQLALVFGSGEGELPDADRVSYQTAFPKEGAYRMPTFMDIFAQFSQQEYINVGLKWNVAESKAAMAYATRASIGHAPIKQATDDYHIEAFSKAATPVATDWTKIRFRQKDTYSGTIGYATPEEGKAGVFQVWDNTKKTYAKLQVGDFQVMKNVVIEGDIHYKGKMTGKAEVTTEKPGTFAGTIIGNSAIGSKMEAQEGKGMAIYTRPKGGKVDEKVPRMFVADNGNIGMGTTQPKATLQVKSADQGTKAVRVDSGDISYGETSAFMLDGIEKGVTASGLRFNVQKEGNIGVNVVMPEEKLHVSGTAKFDSGGTFGPSKATVLITNTMQGCGDHSLRVRDHFYVSACGKIGVKTAVPQAELHVTGNTKTTSLNVDKDAHVGATFHTKKFAHHKGLFHVDKLTVDRDVVLKGKTVLEQDVVIKGNLYVQKEVKMIGQTGGVSEMMESRLALIEESHKSLQESHAAVKEHNKELKDRVADLEKRLLELANSK